MDTPVVTVAVVVVLLADVVGALFVGRKRRSPDLRERFGLRYDRIVSTPATAGRAGPSSRSRRVARDGVSTEDLHGSVSNARSPTSCWEPECRAQPLAPDRMPPVHRDPMVVRVRWTGGAAWLACLSGAAGRGRGPVGRPDPLTSTCGCLVHPSNFGCQCIVDRRMPSALSPARLDLREKPG